MAPNTADWSMFFLGICGALAALWLHHRRRTAIRTSRGIKARTVGKVLVFAGLLFGFQGALEFYRTVRWQVILLGFVAGAFCGGLAGKVWILQHPEGEEIPRLSGLSGWLQSWRVLVVLLFITAAFATVPSLSFVPATISRHAEVDAAGAQGLAGMFLVFGLLLITSHQVGRT